MKQCNFILLIWLICTISLHAQITRDKADDILMEEIKKKADWDKLHSDAKLYIHVIAPNDKGVTVTTLNEETFRAKYACWAYFLKEEENAPCRYLFVKEDNGNFLEIIADFSSEPDDPDSWKEVDLTSDIEVIKSYVKHPYPNPVQDLLTLPCNLGNAHVEIYNLRGACLYFGLASGDGICCQLNVSFLSAGIYMVSINGERHKIIKI